MYKIKKLSDRGYFCSVQVQDGREEWTEQFREQAVWSVIRAARTLNGAYIREDDIEFSDEKPDTYKLADQNRILLDEIQRGAKVVLDCTDPRIRYRITPEECDIIVKIREGYMEVFPPFSKGIRT